MTPMSIADAKTSTGNIKSMEKSKFGAFAPRSALSPIIVKTNNEPKMAPIISAAK